MASFPMFDVTILYHAGHISVTFCALHSISHSLFKKYHIFHNSYCISLNLIV